MIIRFPTGLYKSVLPIGTQPGNITYTISNHDPPRSFVRATQLPIAEELEGSPEKIFDDTERRAQFGELVYTIARSSRSDPGSNSKLFELGESLAFEENPPGEQLVTVEAPDVIDIQHNTNILDLSAAGLTPEEVDALISNAESKQAELEREYLDIQTNISNLTTKITENQKKINEINKTLKAVREINGISQSDLSFDEGIVGEIYQKLLRNLMALTSDREQLISDRNAKAEEAKTIYTAILRVSELVR